MLPLAAVVLCSTFFAAQSPPETPSPKPARISPTLYFPSSTDELKSREALQAHIDPLVHALAAANASSLLRELDLAEQTMIALQRHGVYLRVKMLEDTGDEAARSAHAVIASDEAVVDAAVSSRLRRVPPSAVATLGLYALLAREVQSEAAHALSPEVERYRGAVTSVMEERIADAYDRQMEALGEFAGVASSDTATRRAALAERERAYDGAAPETATMLATLIDMENRDAMAEGFANAAERKYASLGLSGALIDRTLAAMTAAAPVYRHYEQVIAEHGAKKFGAGPMFSAEQDLAFASAPAPIPLEDGSRVILNALAPLGTDYTGRFAQLLDPANGRMDLAGGAHRAHTGTSLVVYDAPVALYVGNYDGTLKSLRVIAHEGGHAIHRELMNANGIPVYERDGSHFLFEGFAMVNELLLFDHAAKAAKTPDAREYALERLLVDLSVGLFTSGEETSFERSLYAEANGRPMLDRVRFDAIYRSSIAPYESWPMTDVGTSRGWMRKSLLFEDPLYLVNYLYASLVAVALYDRIETEPEFAGKYEALLRRGFDADPQTLLASVGIRLDDPVLVARATQLFAFKIEELERLYRSEAAGRH